MGSPRFGITICFCLMLIIIILLNVWVAVGREMAKLVSDDCFHPCVRARPHRTTLKPDLAFLWQDKRTRTAEQIRFVVDIK